MSKFVLIGDVHLRMTSPISRKEKNFAGLCLRKFEEAISIADEEDAIVLQTGDLFDSSRPSFYLVGEIFKILNKYDKILYTIFGNHDQLYHSSKNNINSAQKVLSDCGVLKILNDKAIILNDCEVYGQSWNEACPMVNDSNRKKLLVSHEMVGDKKIFEGQILESPLEFIKRKEGFDVLVNGHYHFPFIYNKSKGKLAVNPGCILRLRNVALERSREPEILLYDSKSNDIEIITLEHEKDVFCEKEDKVSFMDENIKEFIDKLKNRGEIGINFSDSLDKIYSEKSISNDIKSIIDSELRLVENGNKR